MSDFTAKTNGTVRCETDGAIVTLTLSNPGRRNAIDDDMRGELLQCLRQSTTAPAVRAIAIVGEGGIFCAGGHLPSVPTDPDSITARLGGMHDIIRLIHAGPKPVVVGVEGVAFGSGLSLASGADYVVASTEAKLGCTFQKVGVIADTGLHATLPLRIGPASARRVLMNSAILDAGTAHELGLVDAVVPTGQVLEKVQEVAKKWCDAAPLALAATKRMIADQLDASLAREMAEQILLLGSDDFLEGRLAFFERRPPSFTGK
jgi:2-(1,2-epoxy-1,2-dihydrophenyl)acetyl-CoA isomerase